MFTFQMHTGAGGQTCKRKVVPEDIAEEDAAEGGTPDPAIEPQ